MPHENTINRAIQGEDLNDSEDERLCTKEKAQKI